MAHTTLTRDDHQEEDIPLLLESTLRQLPVPSSLSHTPYHAW